MFRSLKFVAIALAALYAAEPAVAQFKPNVRVTLPYLKKIVPPGVKPPLRLLRELPISPSEAAAIAQDRFPGFKVLKLKLRGKAYFITLADDSNVMRVVVSGLDGSFL